MNIVAVYEAMLSNDDKLQQDNKDSYVLPLSSLTPTNDNEPKVKKENKTNWILVGGISAIVLTIGIIAYIKIKK